MIRFTAEDRFVITGASAGIGRACALDLHRRGATVLLMARRGDELERMREESGAPARMIAIPRDLSRDLDGLSAFLQQVAHRHGLLRGLVCAAGMLSNSPLRALHLPAARAMLELNTFAILALMSAFAREAVAAPAAAVVVLSSLSSLRGLTGAAGYSASKGALDALCRSAAAELGQQGYRVNAILPGVVETPMTLAVPSEQLSWMTELQLVPGRIMPEDVAQLSTFLLSDLSRFVTGETIALDGGVGLCLKSHRAVTGARADGGVAHS